MRVLNKKTNPYWSKSVLVQQFVSKRCIFTMEDIFDPM